MKNLKYYFKKAEKEKWAIGQFNFSTLEQFKGILEAAKKTNSPVILGTSEGESRFIGLGQAVALVKFWRKETGLPIFLNLDHGKSFEYIKKAMDRGYDTIHFDGSEMPFEQNIKITKKVVDYARKKGVLVEGELGKIAQAKDVGKSIGVKEKGLTNPDQVGEFIRKAKVDRLAISIGNVHGVCQKMPKLDLERLKRINKNSKLCLVLHGGSGIPAKEIKKAINFGIGKININTELRVIWRRALEDCLKRRPGVDKGYEILHRVSAAIQKKVEEKIKLFGSINKT